MMWCDSHAIDCLYFFAEAEDAETVRIAESHEFHLMDIRIILEKQLTRNPVQEHKFPNCIIRPSTPADIPSLKAIASKSYYDTRFYYDPHFPNSRCGALYETWIEKSCQGDANAVVVAEHEGRSIGYISCHLLDQVTGKIGLVGVRADARGKGFGKRLIQASLQWFAEQGTKQVIIITQGRNVKAQRLYQECGFWTQSVQLGYHCWFR